MNPIDIRPEDLPAWMQPRRAVFDWGMVLVLVACLVVALPLIIRHAVPISSDAEMIELRSVELAHVIQSGILFSRWGPDFTYGFGSPLFNYLAPLPYYLTAYHQTLTDALPADSVNLFLGASILAAGLGMYLFARQRWGAAAGMVAAFIYLFSPPLALLLPYQTGDLPSLMALALLPWIGWSLSRVALHPQRWSFALASLLLAALILTEARIAVLAVIVLVVIGLSWRGRRNVAAVFICAALLAAFFWLPALLERDQIHWTSAHSDELAGPLSLTEIIGLPANYKPTGDTPLLNPAFYRGIGIGTVLLAVAGVGTMVARRRELSDNEVWLFLALGVIFVGAATLPGLWADPNDFLPLLPYHALLIALFCLSVVGAQSAYWLMRLPSRWQAVSLAVLCLIPAFAALIRVEPSRLTAAEPTPLTSLQAELHGYHIGTFTDGFLLPVDVPTLPAPPLNLLASVQANSFTHLDRSSLPADSRLNAVDRGPLSESYVYQIPRQSDVQANLFYYPGWSASVNGQRETVQASASGNVTINIPTLTGEIQIWLEGTLLRYAGWLLSAAGIVVLLFLLRRMHRPNEVTALSVPLPRPQVISLAVAVGFYAIIVFGLSQRPDLFTGGNGTITPLQRSFPNGPQLTGYWLSSATIQAGSQVTLSLYWQTTETSPIDFQSEVQIVGGNAVLVQADHRHPGAIPTSRWQVGDTIRDRFTIQLPVSVSAGTYQLQVNIGQCETENLLACSTIRSLAAVGSSAPITIPITVR